MATYNNQTFTGTVLAGYNTYNNCTFTNALIQLDNKTAYFSGGSMTDCVIAERMLETIAGKTTFQSVTLTRCDIDVTFKVFYYCTMNTCYLLDGCLWNSGSGVSIYNRGFGTEIQNSTLTDTVLSSHAPFWLYNSYSNNFYGTLRSMPMSYYTTVVKSWAELKSGATIYGSLGSAYNTFYAVDGLELLGSGLTYSNISQGSNERMHSNIARDAKLGFAVLSGSNTALSDSVLSFAEVFGGPVRIVGSRTIADGSEGVCPTEICENSSLADTTMQSSSAGPGSFRGTSFRGASFTDMVFTNMYTSSTDITGASGTSCLSSSGTVTSGTYTRGANNLGSMGVVRIDDPSATMRTTPVLAPGTAYLMAVALGNSIRYNYVVETSLTGIVSAYILSYGAVIKAGITSAQMTMTNALLERVESVAALTGDQLQDTYARVESTTAYILVVNNSPSESLTLGISGRTGVFRATGLSANRAYTLSDMTTAVGITATQDAGTLRYNISYDGNTLRSRGHQFDSGFGSHANATITVPTTAGVVGTYAGYAHDDEVRFNRPVDCGTSNLSIKSGSTTYVSTSTINAWNAAQWVYAYHGTVPSVVLKATAPGSISSAHADILYPTFIIDTPYAPSDILLSNSSIVTGQSAGTTVGELSSSDANPGNTFTYTMASGTGDTNNGDFTISGGNLLVSTVEFSVDANETRSIRIRTTDNTSLWFEKVFTISVLAAVIDTDGIVYQTVKIGSQTWTAENGRKASGTYVYSGNDAGTLLTKGRLYDFSSAVANAPPGYRLPTDDDWKALERYIGMTALQVAATGYRGNKGVGLKKNSSLWSSNNGTDLYGFSAVPAGLHAPSSGYWNYTTHAMLWAAMAGTTEGYRWLPGEPGNDTAIFRNVPSEPLRVSARYVRIVTTPIVTSFNHGSVNSGTSYQLEIYGDGFTSVVAPTVMVGAVAATDVVCVSATMITCYILLTELGEYPVTVTNHEGGTFTTEPPLVIYCIEPYS